jgi:putative transposase
MAKKRFSTEDIITKLREAEVWTSQGRTIEEVCRSLEISDQIYYR